ncbi:hypothetical protein [Treponema pedis]|uniref:hypothetical protein n=1 Tax=Treponema pedis TaxID=409322 RepID=UPI0003FB33D1|nr:hypothetical protein [Treponema pedis]
MKQIFFIIILIFNVLIMNAQDFNFFKDKTIRLNDKLYICDEKNYEDIRTEEGYPSYWKLYLKKEGEKDIKLLEESKNYSMFKDDIVMHTPNLIDAYMEGKYLYVFVYKDHKAMLEIYYFKDGVKFEKTGYLLCSIRGGSVMNFGLYGYSVNIRKIGEFHYVKVAAGRKTGFGIRAKFFKIKENDIREIKIEEVSEKSIAYPYIIKELNEDISEDEKKDILFKEFKKQLKDNNLLAPNALIHSAGYIYSKYAYYIFYKTTDEPNKINLVKYGRYYIKHKPYWGWVFCDYTEEVLAPAYSHWNPK